MLGGILLNLPRYGGKQFPDKEERRYSWLESQSKNARLARDDEDLLSIVVTMVTSGEM